MTDTYPQRVLVLYWHPDRKPMRAAIGHHLRVLGYAKVGHHVIYYNTVDNAPRWLRHLDFDAVILHTTFLCMRWSHLFYIWKWKTRWINDLSFAKIALPQDEYDHSEILDEWLAELGVSVIFTNFDESQRKVLYPIMADRATFHKCFTGYIDDRAARRYASKVTPPEIRPHDIVYRASHLPYWFGSHGQLKHRIGDVVSERVKAHGLKSDISTRWEDTVVGERWLDFLMSGRTVIGCESGSSVLDRRGEIRAQIQQILRADPSMSFEEVSARLPAGWDEHQFFALSPRHFEAVITKTCQVLVEGQYESVLKPDRHYIALKRDLSNVDEVLEKIRDLEFVQQIADQAYNDIYLSGAYTYQRLAAEIEGVLIENQRRQRGGARELCVGMLWKVAGPAAAAQSAFGLRIWRFLRMVRSLWRMLTPPSLARGLVTLKFILRTRALRQLLIEYLGDPTLRRDIRLDQVLKELLRLGILRQAQTGTLTAGEPFRTSMCFEAKKGNLTLKSRRMEASKSVEEPVWPVVGSALRDGRVKTVVWDHSALGVSVSYALTRSRWLAISLGQYGVYRFEALPILARRFPELTWEALCAQADGAGAAGISDYPHFGGNS